MSNKHQISDIELERYVLGELPPGPGEKPSGRFTTDEAQIRIRALKDSNEDILKRYPPRMIAAEIRAKAAQEQSSEGTPFLMKILIPSAAALGAALLLWILMPAAEVQRQNDRDEGYYGIKGSQRMIIYRKKADKEEILADNQTVKAGDVLQLKYYVDPNSKAVYGVIFSIDGYGKTTLHFPSSSDASSRLKAKGTQALPYSYELDDAPDFEHFFFLTSEKPLDIDEILTEAKRLGKEDRSFLELNNISGQHDIRLKKDNT